LKDARLDAIFVLSFPILLSLGIGLIPLVPDYSDHALASIGAQQSVRWFAGHMLSAVAFAISILSIHTVKSYFRFQARPSSRLSPVLLTIGAGLYAAGLGADGIGPIAISAAGADPSLFFDGSGWWVSGTFMAATLTFGAGLLLLVRDAISAKLVRGKGAWIMAISAVLFIVFPAIPSGWGLYGEALSAIGVFFPPTVAIWSSA
jgi:hypothetical protein